MSECEFFLHVAWCGDSVLLLVIVLLYFFLFYVHRRNDFISVVRNAARTALENMNIPEAEDVLKVTKVLEDEIAALSTVDHQVAV